MPTPPGGVADLLARAVAQGISANTGKTVIAEQRTGAGGVIAADFVAKAPPDGYTIYMGFHPTQSILVHLQKLPYDPAKDFEPIMLVGSSPNMLVVNPVAAGEDAERARRLRAQESRQDLVRLARQRLVRPHGRRAVQDHAQARPRARALQGRRPGGDRSRRRPHPDDVRHRSAGARAASCRQGARARRDVAAAAAGGAGRADHGGAGHAGARGRSVVRTPCARENPTPDHRLAQCRGEEGDVGRRGCAPSSRRSVWWCRSGARRISGKYIADDTQRWGDIIKRAGIKL